MRSDLSRRVALQLCRLLHGMAPVQLRSWTAAILHEAAAIDNPAEALRFATGCFGKLAPRILALHLAYPVLLVAGSSDLSYGGSIDMKFLNDIVRRPRVVGVASALAATGLGIVYMLMAGAPMSYLAVNAGALILGFSLLTALGRSGRAIEILAGGQGSLLMAAALLATSLFGSQVEGAARWVSIAGLYIQPSLILLPVMMVGFAQSRTVIATLAIIIAAIALAIQPDRAMSGMLAAGLGALVTMRRDGRAVIAFVASVAAFVVTMLKADNLPAVPYVDQIVYLAFDVHFVAGLAVLLGLGVLLFPAVAGWVNDRADGPIYAVFGAAWLAAIAAAALGNYPTPVVGYSGGAILGYVLSLAMLPKLTRSRLGACDAERRASVVSRRQGIADFAGPGRFRQAATG